MQRDPDDEMDPARAGHPLQRCLNVVEDLLSMPEAEPFGKPVRAVLQSSTLLVRQSNCSAPASES